MGERSASAGQLEERGLLYEKDGEKYFVVDEHIHFRDASPENTTNEYGEGFTSKV